MTKFSSYRAIFPAILLIAQGFRGSAYQFSRSTVTQLSLPNRCYSSVKCASSSADGETESAGSKIVFVGNLPFDYTEAELKSLVLAQGIKGLSQTRIATNRKSGLSRGFGYADFESEEMAENSLALLDGLEVNGRPLKIDLDGGKDTPTKGRRQPSTSSEFSAFIGNLDFGVSTEDVSTLIKSILDENVPFKVRFAYTLESQFRGFGHVDFGSEEAVTKVVEALNGMQMMSRELRVERAEGKEVRTAEESRRRAFEAFAGAGTGPSDQHSVFLGNLAYDVSIESIVELMDKLLGQGKVKAVRLSTDRETGQMKGFGHADFDSAEDAFEAATKLNGADLAGRALKADVAVPKVRTFNEEGGFRGGRGGGGGGRGGDRGSDRGGGDDAWGDSAGPKFSGGAVSSGRGGGGSGRGGGESYGRGGGGSGRGGEGSYGRGGGGSGRGERSSFGRSEGGRGRGRGDRDSRGSGRGGGRGSGRGGGRGGGSSGADTGSFGAW
jgi:RNA recognition motif-containing protein